MKKICLITPVMTTGGERKLLTLADKFIKDGYNVKIILIHKGRSRYKDYNRKIKIVGLDKRSIFSLIKEMRKEDADIYITLAPVANLYALVANIVLRKNIIITEGSSPEIAFKKPASYFYKKPHMEILYKLLCDTATGMAFQTEQQKGYYGKRICKKSTIIENPIKEGLPKKNIGENKKEIVAVGALKVAKNYPLLLTSFAEVHKKYPEFTLSIYGVGILKNELLSLASKLGIADKVQFKGFFENVHDCIKDSFMYVLSSDFEGMSNALMEAMAMGFPVISTDCSGKGSAVLIENEVNGLLVPAGDKDALARAMIRIIEDEELRIKISTNAFKIRDKYNADEIYKKWLKYIKKLTKN